jgi:tetratricopeptide (TPR) repeat protein
MWRRAEMLLWCYFLQSNVGLRGAVVPHFALLYFVGRMLWGRIVRCFLLGDLLQHVVGHMKGQMPLPLYPFSSWFWSPLSSILLLQVEELHKWRSRCPFHCMFLLVNLEPSFYCPGTCYYKLRDYRKAEADVRTNLRMQPRNADGYRLLGRVLISQGDCRTGIAQLLKAVELNPAAKDVYVNIAQVLLSLVQRWNVAGASTSNAACLLVLLVRHQAAVMLKHRINCLLRDTNQVVASGSRSCLL